MWKQRNEGLWLVGWLWSRLPIGCCPRGDAQVKNEEIRIHNSVVPRHRMSIHDLRNFFLMTAAENNIPTSYPWKYLQISINQTAKMNENWKKIAIFYLQKLQFMFFKFFWKYNCHAHLNIQNKHCDWSSFEAAQVI